MTMISPTPTPTRVVADRRVEHVHALVCPHPSEPTANLAKPRLIQLEIGRSTPITTLRSHPVQYASSLSALQQTNSKPIGAGSR